MEGTIIDTMSTEITGVLKKNLYALLNPILEEQTKTNDALLNFPMAKKLQNRIQELEQKLLETNCQKNIKIFELKQEIQKQNEKIQSLEKQLNSICSIKLEVKEIEKSPSDVDIDSIDLITVGSNKKISLEKKVKLTSNMWTELSDGSDEEDGSHLFDEDADEEADEEEVDEDADEEEAEEEEEVDEEDDNKSSAFISTVLRAQESDNYATIDTASEEEEDVEETEEAQNAVKNEEKFNSSDEEELELEEVVINEIKYLTDSIINGSIYKCDDEGEIIEDDDGDLITVGKYSNKKPQLYF